jgi:hypothetical protein
LVGGITVPDIMGRRDGDHGIYSVRGAALVWFPAAIYLAIQGAYVQSAVLVVAGIVLAAVIDDLVRNIIVGKASKLHSLIMFFSVIRRHSLLWHCRHRGRPIGRCGGRDAPGDVPKRIGRAGSERDEREALREVDRTWKRNWLMA